MFLFKVIILFFYSFFLHLYPRKLRDKHRLNENNNIYMRLTVLVFLLYKQALKERFHLEFNKFKFALRDLKFQKSLVVNS